MFPNKTPPLSVTVATSVLPRQPMTSLTDLELKDPENTAQYLLDQLNDCHVLITWREEGHEERVSLLQFGLAVHQETPVGPVATARGELVDFDKHVLTD